MVKKDYGLLEQHIISLFNQEKRFVFEGKEYTVVIADKPRPSSGECKTDVYVLAIDNCKNKIELKISAKLKSSNEFQENKVNAARAEAYLGENWSEIISKAAYSIHEKFEEKHLIYVSKHHPTAANSITLGWKFEIASKPRALSVKAPLTIDEVRNYVYKGTNQTEIKKHSFVNKERIKNSGIADCLLISEIDELKTVDDIINNLILIDNYIPPETHFIFTANNYRTKENKADGPRPLAVYIKWSCKNKKLCHEICYDSPLKYTGENDIKPILLNALDELCKYHPCDFDCNCDIENPNILLP